MNNGAQWVKAAAKQRKGKEKRRPEDEEIEALEAQPPHKLIRGEKLLISHSTTCSSLSKPLSPGDITFGVTAGSANLFPSSLRAKDTPTSRCQLTLNLC